MFLLNSRCRSCVKIQVSARSLVANTSATTCVSYDYLVTAPRAQLESVSLARQIDR